MYLSNIVLLLFIKLGIDINIASTEEISINGIEIHSNQNPIAESTLYHQVPYLFVLKFFIKIIIDQIIKYPNPPTSEWK